jgi:hypothetical protein
VADLALSTSAYTRHDLPAAFRRIAGHDYAGVGVFGDDPTEAIRRTDDRITGVHPADIVGCVRGNHNHRIPGEGDLDLAATLDALDDVGDDGFATLAPGRDLPESSRHDSGLSGSILVAIVS